MHHKYCVNTKTLRSVKYYGVGRVVSDGAPYGPLQRAGSTEGPSQRRTEEDAVFLRGAVLILVSMLLILRASMLLLILKLMLKLQLRFMVVLVHNIMLMLMGYYNT